MPLELDLNYERDPKMDLGQWDSIERQFLSHNMLEVGVFMAHAKSPISNYEEKIKNENLYQIPLC